MKRITMATLDRSNLEFRFFSSFSQMYLQNLSSSRKTMYLIFFNLSLKLNNQYCQVVKLIYFSRNERVGDVQQLSRVVYASVQRNHTHLDFPFNELGTFDHFVQHQLDNVILATRALPSKLAESCTKNHHSRSFIMEKSQHSTHYYEIKSRNLWQMHTNDVLRARYCMPQVLPPNCTAARMCQHCSRFLSQISFFLQCGSCCLFIQAK